MKLRLVKCTGYEPKRELNSCRPVGLIHRSLLCVIEEELIAIHTYAGVIVDVRASSVDRIFHYLIPTSLPKIQVGHRVLVPFGNRRLEGYVLEFTDITDIDETKIKSIIKLLDERPMLTKEQIQVARWMANRYLSCLSQALQCFLPVGSRYGKERVRAKQHLVASIKDSGMVFELIQALPKNANKQRSVLTVLAEKSPLSANELCNLTGATYQTLRALKAKGYIELANTTIWRDPGIITRNERDYKLNPKQLEAYLAIKEEMMGTHKPILLHGVTGSGKTEVYLKAIRDALAQRKQVIMLVPEIALTSQTISRFTNQFPNQVAVIHSGLSEGERFDQWQRISSGELPIVIGARSGIFAPVQTIGLIVLDEEHETTYKQEEGSLKYHTRQVAIELGRIHQAVVILGSATPSLDSYHKAIRGNYRLVEIPDRVVDRPLPKISLVDMRQEFHKGNRSMFSQELTDYLDRVLTRNEQAIIFLNRRGFSSFVLCRECGHVIECRNCQVSLTYHQSDKYLHCHYCSAKEALPSSCPKCASKFLRQFGSGTQQVEQFIRENFPKARSTRLDTDTTSRKGAHHRLLEEFRSKRSNVLIGTQMIAKGLDFPDVTLVGVLSADLSLNFPDFRASERTFQLLTQVSGRAGRDKKKGHVIIQCYDPQHYALQAVANYDYLGLYGQEISFRRQLNYPPFGELIRVLIQGENQSAQEYGVVLHSFFSEQLPDHEIYGPSPAPISRIKGRYRWHILIKTADDIKDVLRVIPRAPKSLSVTIDVEPLFLL